MQQQPIVDYRTEPSQYRHWSFEVDGNIARLKLDIAEDGGIRPGYKLKLNSYDLGVDVELHKVGLHLINANITDIQDASGYINALGKEAAARAINDATIKVAEETRRGEIGKAEAEKDQTIQVANARAIAIEGQNEAQIKIAESAAKLQVKQAEAKKLAEVAQKVQEAKTLEEAYQAEKEAELKRAERERATQEANILVTARIEKSQREVQAQATAEVLKLEQEGKAQALLIQRRAEAEAIRQLAEGEAQATLLKKKAEAEGVQLDDEVAFYIAKHLRSNVRELEGALKKVLAYASFHGKRIDLERIEARFPCRGHCFSSVGQRPHPFGIAFAHGGTGRQHIAGEIPRHVADLFLFLGQDRQFSLSMATAVASPPPMQSEAMPRLSPWCSSAFSSVTMTRAPDAPMGWPSAQAPPFTFSF